MFRAESRHQGELARVLIGGEDIWLLKPMTFMNRSGASMGWTCGFYKIGIGQVLIAHDEIDLPAGAVRLKQGGGHGGHNGLRDAIAAVGEGFWRLRLGVGHPGSRDQVVDYVLRKPAPEHREAIPVAMARSLDARDELMAGDMERATLKIHAGPQRPKPPRPAPAVAAAPTDGAAPSAATPQDPKPKPPSTPEPGASS